MKGETKGETTSKSYRLTEKQLDLIEDTKKKPPFPKTDSEALRLIFDRASGAPEPVWLTAGVASSEDLHAFYRRVAALIRSIQDLRSAIAGNLEPSSYDDPVMKQVIEELRQLAEDLPEELRKIRDQTLRMADLLGVGITPKELKGLRRAQRFCSRVIAGKDDELKKLSPENQLKFGEYLAEVIAALLILNRLFGPAPTIHPHGRSQTNTN